MTAFLTSLLGRLPIGWLQLRHNRTRLIAALAGVTFANLLIYMQLGFLGALLNGIRLPYASFDADILIQASDANTLQDGSPLPRNRMLEALSVPGVAEATPGAIQRLARSVVEACKQCGRNTLLEIASPLTMAEVLAGRDAATLSLVADPEGEPLGPALAGHAGSVLALVGPEGGFTAEELAMATAANCRRVSLAPHVLRVETAAIALAAGIWAERADRDARATAATTGENGPGDGV
jgi:hypothetical protein